MATRKIITVRQNSSIYDLEIERKKENRFGCSREMAPGVALMNNTWVQGKILTVMFYVIGVNISFKYGVFFGLHFIS